MRWRDDMNFFKGVIYAVAIEIIFIIIIVIGGYLLFMK